MFGQVGALVRAAVTSSASAGLLEGPGAGNFNFLALPDPLDSLCGLREPVAVRRVRAAAELRSVNHGLRVPRGLMEALDQDDPMSDRPISTVFRASFSGGRVFLFTRGLTGQ